MAKRLGGITNGGVVKRGLLAGVLEGGDAERLQSSKLLRVKRVGR